MQEMKNIPICLVAIAILCLGVAGWTSASGNGEIIVWGSSTSAVRNVPAPNSDFVAIAGTSFGVFTLKSDSSIVAWGTSSFHAGNVPAPNTGFVAVSGDGDHAFGLKSDGSIVAWGSNDYGECNVPSPNSGFIEVVAGSQSGLGLKSDGSIVTWGRNYYGQLDVPLPNSGFVAISGGSQSLGLKSDGSIVAWGRNLSGECNVPSPNSGFVAVKAASFYSLGLKSDGSIVAWGNNYNGQCNVPAPNSGFVAVSGGPYFSAGLKSNGSIVAWGQNSHGECNVPTPNSGFAAVSTAQSTCLGIKSDAPTSFSLKLASLRVTILPSDAVADGGTQWRRAGTSTWHDSGETETGVPVGVYRIELKDSPSWAELGQLVYVSPFGLDTTIPGYRPYATGEVTQMADGTHVHLAPAIVTAAWNGVFYVSDQSSGIRVEQASHGRDPGDPVSVVGSLGTTADGERFIQASNADDAQYTGSVEPVGMNCRVVGGGDKNYLPGALWPNTLSGQKGVLDGVGLNNIGLLVRAWGRITEKDSATPPTWLRIDDGSGASVKCLIPSTVEIDPGWLFVGVTGISSCEKVGDDLLRLLRVREQSDITPY